MQALGSAAPGGIESERPPLRFRHAIGPLARCALRTARLLAAGRIRQPTGRVGIEVPFRDGSTGRIYRETVIEGQTATSPAVLIVGFRLRRIHSEGAHRLFRLESELNTALFAGFPGLVSKLWLQHDEHHYYRGIYQWDGPELGVAYVRALWWALALVSERGSIHYAVLPGLGRDEVLTDPAVVDETLSTSPGGWWRPLVQPAGFHATSPRRLRAGPGAGPSQRRRHGPWRTMGHSIGGHDDP